MKNSTLIAIVAIATILVSCGGSEPEILSVQQRLEQIENRELTSSEVSEKVELAELVCQLQPDVQEALWKQLNQRQLEFQDFIFEVVCTQHQDFYIEATGRLSN